MHVGLFRSLEDDAKVYAGIENNVARSPELSGVTYVQGSRGVWGMPHMLQIVDVAHVDAMGAVLNANESSLRADAHEIDRHGEHCHINVWVALTGPAALAGRLFRCVDTSYIGACIFEQYASKIFQTTII